MGSGTVTTFQPNAIVNPHNSRVIRNPMRNKMREEILTSHCYVFNITPQNYGPIHRTHGAYHIFGNDSLDQVPEELVDERYGFGQIKARGENIVYSWAKLNGRIELVENGIETGRGVSYDEVATEAELIAEDVVNWCNQNRAGVGNESGAIEPFVGVFFEPGTGNPVPSEDGAYSAQRRMVAYYKALVEAGDQIYMENKDNQNPLKDRPETIMKMAFRTLKAMGKVNGEKPWVYEMAAAPEMNPCRACFSPIPKGALRCVHCHAFQIHDEEVLRQFFPHEFPVKSKVTPSQS